MEGSSSINDKFNYVAVYLFDKKLEEGLYFRRG